MAALNAAGGVGMLVGTTAAGIVSSLWRHAGGEASVVFPAIFAAAGVVQWGVGLSSIAWGEREAVAGEIPEAAALP